MSERSAKTTPRREVLRLLQPLGSRAHAPPGDAPAPVEKLVSAALPMPVFVADPEGSLVYRNRAFERFVGHPDGATPVLLRGSWPEEFHVGDRGTLERALHGGLRERSGFRVEFRLRRADGALRWMRGTAVALFDGRVFRGLACYCVDVTEGVATLEHLRRAGREAGSESRATRRPPAPDPRGGTLVPPASQERARIVEGQKYATIGMLAGAFAHDLKNLLTGILGHAALARDTPASGHGREGDLQRIEEASLRASELASQMLVVSGRGHPETGFWDVNRLIADMRSLLDLGGAEIRTDLQADLPPVRGNPAQLRQLLMNLVLNAADAVESTGGEVLLQTGVRVLEEGGASPGHGSGYHGADLAAGEYVWIRIADNGVGMDALTRSRMFETFYSTKERGHGLGLATALWILLEHGGGVSVESAPGLGTTMEVVLPVAARESDEEDPGCSAPTELAGCRGVRRATILVVDDEKLVRETVQRILEREGHRVLTASDGLEALECYARHHTEVDLVLLDVTMPHCGGVETHASLRRLDAHIPILLFSGYAEEDVAGMIPPEETAGFVHKLSLPETLAGVIESVLTHRRESGTR